MPTPLVQGTMERIMIAGLPRAITIMGAGMSASLVLGVQNYKVIPLIPIAYIALLLLYKKDQYFLEIILSHMKEDDHLGV